MPIRYKGKHRPLPDNYPKLDEAARRVARLNALRLQETPEDVAHAWSLFHSYHLEGTRKRDVASPSLHFEWVYSCAKWARNMIAAPRSFAKSVIVGKEYPLFIALTRPDTEVLIVVSTQDKATKRGKWFLHQLTRNERLREDLGDMKGVPGRDNRQWNFTQIDLANGSSLTISSVGSLHLGERPDLIILDDVEPDPDKVANWKRVVEEIYSTVFDVFLPMLDHGTAIAMIGTLLHRKAFLYWAVTTSDSRLKYWHRTLSAIEDLRGVPQWEAKFDRRAIAQLKDEYKSKFFAQFMNEPMSGDDCVLKLHPRRNLYTLEGIDDALRVAPLKSEAKLTYYTSDRLDAGEFEDCWKAQEVRAGLHFQGMYRFLCVDYAQGTSDYHDYSAVHVMGEDVDDVIWSLDLWAGRKSVDQVADKVEELAYRWDVRLVAIEAIGLYKALFEKVQKSRGELERRHGWVPRIMQVKYPPHMRKETRIAGLEWRFSRGRVRLPDADTPAYRMLKYQVENFTEDGGNLQFDDCIDTLAMQGFVLRPRARGLTDESLESARKSLAQRLVDGEVYDKVSGVPLASGMTQAEIPFNAIRAKKREEEEKMREKARKRRRERPSSKLKLPVTFTMEDLVKTLESHDSRRRR